MAESPRIILTAHDGAALGDLDPAQVVELVAVSEINGENYLHVITTQELSKGDRLLWRDEMNAWHEYVIEGVETNHGETGTPLNTYYCPWSVQYDLARTYVSSMPGTGGTPATATQALTAALAGTERWAVGTVDVTTTGSASFYRMSGWESLQILVETWGGEVEPVITVSLGGVVSRAVNLKNHVGATTATRRFDYGGDVVGIKRTVSDEPWTARVIPLGAAQETAGGGYGRKVDISSVNGGTLYLEDADAVPLTRVPDGGGGWEVPVQVVENEAMETPATLKQWAQDNLAQWTTPKASYEADVVQLEGAGMGAHGVALGDACGVVDKAFGSVPIRITTRLLRIEENILDRSQTVLTFSNLAGTLGGQLADIARSAATAQSQITNLSLNQSTASYISALLQRVNAEANATGGYTYITEGEGLRTYDVAVSDPLVGAEASSVVEIKGGTIRIANTRDGGGNWEWKTVFTSGHIAGELVTAAQIITGYIGSAGGTYIDLDNDTVQLGQSNKAHAIIDADSLDITYGLTEITHFGYGEGTAQSGTAIAPYYTIGTRASGSTVGNYSVAEGYNATASGYTSHAEGGSTTASETFSHAEGCRTVASGYYSHAEGYNTTASETSSHAEGYDTTASGPISHAEGSNTTASGGNSHAEGYDSTASGNYSHAQNYRTIAASKNQTALGKYNVEDNADTYAVIVGNGTSDSARSNALTVDWDGNVETAGSSTIRTSNIDRNGTAPSTNQFSNGRFRIADVDGNAIAWYDGYQLTTGETGARLVAFAEDANGNAINNSFRVGKKPDGTNLYYVTDPAAFREAINAVGTSDQSSQNATLISLTTATQHWALRSNVINSNNTTYRGHSTGLGMTDTNAFFYDFTGQSSIWTAYTTKSPQPADAWDVYKSTTVSQVITAGSGRTVSSVTYAEWGKVAMLSVSISGWAASTGSQTGGTVVSGKRPVYNVYATDVSSSYAVYAQLTSAGALTVYWGTAPSTSASYTIKFVYILA